MVFFYGLVLLMLSHYSCGCLVNLSARSIDERHRVRQRLVAVSRVFKLHLLNVRPPPDFYGSYEHIHLRKIETHCKY